MVRVIIPNEPLCEVNFSLPHLILVPPAAAGSKTTWVFTALELVVVPQLIFLLYTLFPIYGFSFDATGPFPRLTHEQFVSARTLAISGPKLLPLEIKSSGLNFSSLFYPHDGCPKIQFKLLLRDCPSESRKQSYFMQPSLTTDCHNLSLLSFFTIFVMV